MKLTKSNIVNYEEVKKVVNELIKDANLPDSQQNTVTEYITDELIRKIDFYTNRFYMITTKDNNFIRYDTSSSGSKEVFLGVAASSATVFDDIISCNKIVSKCKSKYPSENFLIKSFEY